MSAKAAARGGGKAKGKAPARGRGKSAAPSPLGEIVRRVSGWIFVAVLIALAIAALLVLRVPRMVGASFGEAAGAAGFVVRGWEIKGARHLDERRINDVIDAVVKQNRAQPLVDIAEIRRQLLAFGWVADARVSRRLPDRLVVDIVERQPRAVWQNQGMLVLIDGEGVSLDYVKLEALPNLPVVVGPQANRHIAELDRLIQEAPRLRPLLSAATWVGDRRWDLKFHTGEVLALPEGEQAAARALAFFDHKDQATQLLGHGFVRFDLRVPGKMVVRVSDEPGSTVSSIVPDTPPATAAAPENSPPAAPAPTPLPPTPKHKAGAVPDPTKTI